MKSLRFLRIIFFFASSVLITAAVVSFVTGQRFVEASQGVMRTHEVSRQIELVHANVEDVEAGIQAILYTGEVPDLSNYQDALFGLPQQLKQLRRMLADPRMLQRLDVLEVDIRSRSLTAEELLALSVLRVIQEDLHNGGKYSRAKAINVELQGSPEELSLLISDNGVGFDVGGSAPGCWPGTGQHA